MTISLNGQWLGNLKIGKIYHLTLNIELINGNYLGKAILNDSRPNEPSFLSEATLTFIQGKVIINLTNFIVINPKNLLPAFGNPEYVTSQYPNFNLPKKIEMQGQFIEERLRGNSTMDVGPKIVGEFDIGISQADKPSAYPTEKISNLREFNEYIEQFKENRTCVFRGQSGAWRLRTSFHRTGRCDLMSYDANNVAELRRHIGSDLNRLINIRDPEEYGAFLFLAQHHGYPTPLLDWTFSPYVAAYFAFADATETRSQETVKIFIFDLEKWNLARKSEFFPNICTTQLSLEFLKLPVLNNNRALPQQSITLFSNVDDIEGYIHECEVWRYNENFLKVVELPKDTRKEIIKELSYMNITASSLFPGLDGTCKMLKELHFDG